MKIHLVFLLAGLLSRNAMAQTADGYVTQGRAVLAAHDIVNANAKFAQALALNPSHADANAFYGITRVLSLSYQPAGSNFLTRIGYPAAGRDIYDWTSQLPEDSQGLLAPAGVNANEFTAQLRTNVLPVIAGAIGNLSSITNTHYSIDLSSQETTTIAVTVDYGDLKMMEAGLYAAEYLAYTLNGQNLDVQLTAFRSLKTNGTLSLAKMASQYPQLFTYATTNDLLAARAAFTNAVNCYMAASAFIRNRPADQVRLFNFDEAMMEREGSFRLILQDLKNSLVLGPQILAVNPDLMVDITPQFSGATPWRSLLPRFESNAIVLGSLPDLTFGGVIDGLTRDQVEGALGRRMTMLPLGYAPSPGTSNTVKLSFATLGGHPYTLQFSSNLVTWLTATQFFASASVSELTDPHAVSRRFYRLRDDSQFLVYAGVVHDSGTGLPIQGAQVLSVWDGASTLTDSSGQFHLVTSFSAKSWFWDELEVSASSYITSDDYYFSQGFLSGLQIYLTR